MRATLVVVLGFAWLAAFVPAADAQQAVAKCSRECDPKDPDVNGATPITNGPVKVFFYPHFDFVLVNSEPMNLQQPERPFSGTRPLLLPQVDPSNPRVDNCFEQVWFTSPGDVLYLEDGTWRTHQQPGLSGHLRVSPVGNVLYIYAVPDMVPGPNSAGLAPVVEASAKVVSGRTSRGGMLYAEGSVRGFLVAPGPSTPLIEFRVPLSIKETVWSGDVAADGFSVIIRICQVEAGPVSAQVGDWRLEHGPGHFSRLILSVENEMEPRAMFVQEYNRNVYVRASIAPTFGSYDLNASSVRLAVSGPHALAASDIRLVVIKRNVDHDGHFRPVNVTWEIPFGAIRQAGPWRFDAVVENIQGTFRLEQSATYSMAEFPGESIPSSPCVPALSVLFLVVATLRRSARTQRGR